MRDLDEVGSSYVLVKGGAGGSHLTTNYQGQKGTRGIFTLELKLIAEVGMVGYVSLFSLLPHYGYFHSLYGIQVPQCRQVNTALCSL